MGRTKISDTQISVRVPKPVAERAATLADRLNEEEAFAAANPSGVLTSTVFRLALLRGLADLEREFPIKRGRK